MSDYSRNENVGPGERIIDAVWRNPEGLLLLAAGAALLMRRGVSSTEGLAIISFDRGSVTGTLLATDQQCATSAIGRQTPLIPLANMRPTWRIR